jgi:hypothetical protein
MSLPRTFVGFSSTDIDSYHLMCAWKAHDHIKFNFCNCQLQRELYSNTESYIKDRCRERLEMAGTYLMLIGKDTRLKERYVLWEAEIAIEKQCRIIAVNLDGWTRVNPLTCPPMMLSADALFVPFSPHIVGYALEHWQRPQPPINGSHYYNDSVYRQLGYTISGYIARRPPRLMPW